ncbi:pectin acetylesterase 8-like isoform X1 [Zingiber officinale]|uniref:pectin acetylesterase 8-like isoform X1 n=2 Tax=Zingiber officinale TaxID=94328 RepID=UPI001C4CD137|nr:pectin acetylesterase 8-like isoform X1 [Zingiber officinale]
MEDDKIGALTLSLICTYCLLLVNGYDVPMTLLESAVDQGAVCLDGSPPAYHFSPGFDSGANNWLVHMEGGGWCTSIQDCLARKDTFRGSSKYMKPLSFSGILGNRQKSNPDFYNWNKVKIRYCDGSSFTGDVDEVDPATNLYFRGAKVWLAVIEELLEKGMNKAEKALLSGCSAGGLASILHCDRFHDLVPENATVKCLSDAGFFINTKDISGAESIASYYSNVVGTHGSAKNLPSSCTARMTPSMCFFPQYVVPEMRTPLFILNAAYDAWQIKNILAPSSADPHKTWSNCKLDINQCSSDQLETMHGFRSQFLSALPVLENSSIGMFINSCYAHCQSGSQDTWLAADSPSLNNTPIATAVGDWFYGRTMFQKIDCAYPCDSSCINRVED